MHTVSLHVTKIIHLSLNTDGMNTEPVNKSI